MPLVLARVLLIVAVLILSLPHGVLAAGEVSCEAAGAEAERAWQLPPGLLAAIGRIESGRYDPAAGKVAAWPWTINAAGQGRYFDSADNAVAAVRDLQMRGVRLIDVGCFQIDLYYHPGAFATLEDGFDARRNANYAARFLSELYGRTGSWEAAVGAYHSAVPEEGGPYRNRVIADWQGGGLRIAAALTPFRAARATAAADPVAVLVSAAALRVHVFTPTAFTPRPAVALAVAATPDPFVPVRRVGASARLPRVITPHG
jgi:hypothetical protein